MSIGASSVRPRSQTASVRPRSKYLLLSSLERRTSLHADDLHRVLAWADEAAGAPGASGTQPPGGLDIDRQMERRRRVALELYESEKRYVAGLTALDTLYYTPLLRALDRDAIVSRSTLNGLFANFVDILQLSRELLCRLEERVGDPAALVAAAAPAAPAGAAPEWDPWCDLLGDLLVPIAPFFKMYTLFMQNFAGAMQCLADERATNERFAAFLHRAEADAAARGGGAELGLQAQLLTLVQRVPRYRLLLQQLLHHTPTWHADHAPLRRTYELVDATAAAINEHVRQQELTLVALSLQRALVGLDEPLVAPGRRLLRHGTLLKTRRKDIQPRHVYLFSDCLLVASAAHARAERGADEDAPWPLTAGGASLYLTHKLPLAACTVVAYDEPAPVRAGLPQSRSMPDLSTGAGGAAVPLRHRFDVHSPECSFSLYAASADAKHAWITAIREAHADHLAAMRSLRRTRDAASPPRRASSSSSTSSSGLSHLSELDAAPATPRAVARPHTPVSPGATPRAVPVLAHYHPPVWVPDSVATQCTRCAEPFTLWRRRHHCRLCGHVFCATCSAAAVRVPPAAPTGRGARARACLACYAYACRAAPALEPPAAPDARDAAAVAPPTTPRLSTATTPAVRLVPDMVPPDDSVCASTASPPCTTPVARRRPARRWSIVSVPLSLGAEDGAPPCHVHASTSGTLTLELHERAAPGAGAMGPPLPPLPPSPPSPTPAPPETSPPVRRARSAGAYVCGTPPPTSSPAAPRSHAAQWLHTMLHRPPPSALRTP
ncbi:hypothetical protein CBS9595_004109 [Malassezia furfur]|nr:hypothetical protein CBS9595_004109 [Malassezia furfur]